MSATHVYTNHIPDDVRSSLPRPFRLDLEPERDAARVCPVGEIDSATIGSIRERIAEVVSAGFTCVVLDLRRATFVDSNVLHLTLELDASSRSDGWQFAIIDGPPAVSRLFEITGLRPRLPFIGAGDFAVRRWRR
jgi:anti-anti-sigma factor